MTAAMADSAPLADVLGDNLRENAVGPIRTGGRAYHLFFDAVRAIVTDTLSWRFPIKEAITVGWYLVGVTLLPALLMAIPFGVIVTVQIGNIMSQVGAQSLLGAASGAAVIQQAAPIAAGLLLGGAGASAIAADLGARNIREEIDALRALGIDPVRRLVAPRIVASVIVAPLLSLFIILVGVIAGFYLATTAHGVSPGSYWLSFGAFTSIRDLALAEVKAAVFGLIIAVIGCHRGLEAKGGPRGVADAVNASVVLGFVAVFVTNLLTTQIQSMFFPSQVG